MATRGRHFDFDIKIALFSHTRRCKDAISVIATECPALVNDQRKRHVIAICVLQFRRDGSRSLSSRQLFVETDRKYNRSQGMKTRIDQGFDRIPITSWNRITSRKGMADAYITAVRRLLSSEAPRPQTYSPAHHELPHTRPSMYQSADRHSPR
ncbi:unnamed protein product [Mycena citricolor]|uniref:Uncharacterized protein n=1 Tax=Mycena citricolor TaxID=2018698 RepID=A0AAD2HTP1_9AGAR|nr:unnamed protein product [Mycena citricolor]